MAARTPLLVTTLVLVGAVQLGAQEEYTWTADRPDAVAPAGVFADRVLPEGALEVSARYGQARGEGLRWETDVFTPGSLFDIFDIVPLSQNTTTYQFSAAVGLADDLTLVARTGFAQKRREQVTVNDDYFVVEADGMTDSDVSLLWSVWERGAVRAHLQGGVILPTGDVDLTGGVQGIRTGVLPYDMQTGTGSVGLLPGIGAEIQNDVATVGGQVQARIYLADNDREWRPGNALQANVWAAYRLNRFFSASARMDATTWGIIRGRDPALVPLRDPGELADSYGGERVDVPVGLNIYMPEGVLAGHRLSVEYSWTVHEDLKGPWIAASDGFIFSWQKRF